MASKRIRRLIELILDGTKARKAERDTQDSLKRATDPKTPARNLTAVEKGMQRIKLAAVGIAAAIGTGVVMGFRKMIRESVEAQNTSAQLRSVIASTGGAAGKTAEELEAQASALQKVTTFSDDAVKSAQALLLTFTGIKGQTFDDATEVVLDLAQAMGGDLKSASIQVGKALNDPVKGITALQRVGVSFTESQKEQIKVLAESGRMVEAQAMILAELRKEFGGSAQAARNTLGGALIGLQNTWGDLFEVTGESSRGMIGAINALAEWLPKLRTVVDTVFGALQDQWTQIKLNIAGFYEMLGRISQHVPVLNRWSDAWTKVGESMRLSVEMSTGTGRFARMGTHGSPMRTLAVDTEDAADATDKLREAEDKRLKLLTQAVELGIARNNEQQELVRIWMETSRALREGNQPLEERIRLMERMKTAAEALGVDDAVERRDMSAQLRPPIRFPGKGELKPITKPGVPAPIPEDSAAFTFLIDNLEEVTNAAQVAALGIQQSFEDAFAALFQEGEGFAGFFETLFRGMAASALGALAEIAAGKVAENIAYAVEALAKGLLFGDPKALAAAAVFAKSAALWALVGGVTGAAAKAAGGGGSRPGGNPVGREVDKVDRSGPDIIIKLDGVDPSNPRHQRLIGETSKEYQSRYGGRVRMEGR